MTGMPIHRLVMPVWGVTVLLFLLQYNRSDDDTRSCRTAGEIRNEREKTASYVMYRGLTFICDVSFRMCLDPLKLDLGPSPWC